jgi:hypothetical protein
MPSSFSRAESVLNWNLAGRWCIALAVVLCAVGVEAEAVAPVDAQEGVLVGAPEGVPALSRRAQVAQAGYTEDEWFLRGRARTYAAVGEWGDDGHWAVEPRKPARAYETRVLVRRPRDPARFNGVVIVEWLNTSLGFELDGGWAVDSEEITREGYAWVGVSADARSIDSLQQARPSRYATSHVEDDDMGFDIYAQAGRAIRRAAPQWGQPAASSTRPLPVTVIGMGYSRSASFLFTYMNAFHLQDHVFDGYLVRGAAAAAPHVNNWLVNAVASPRIRADLNVPLMQVQTEMEAGISWGLSKTPDTDKLRYWEVAGTTHFDRFMIDDALAADNGDIPLATPSCVRTLSPLSARWFDHAALHALRRWIVDRAPPPKAPRLARTEHGFVKDDDIGHAEGGLRLPDLDLPVQRYGMFGFSHGNFPSWPWTGWSGFACMAGGTAVPLDARALRARYPEGKAGYMRAYRRAADKLVKDGFLRPADHALLVQQAERIVLPE